MAVARLSAGQRRRASIAVLVARRPELWLLDEPHAGLDAEARDTVDDLVRGAAQAGATVLVASHELERSQALAGRVVTIAGGVIEARGSADADRSRRRRPRSSASGPATRPHRGRRPRCTRPAGVTHVP